MILEEPYRVEFQPDQTRRVILNRAIEDTDKAFEILDHRLVIPPRPAKHVAVVHELLLQLLRHRTQIAGNWYVGMMYDLPGIDDFFRPMLSFVSSARWPKSRPIPDGEAWSVVPEMIVEVEESQTRTGTRIPRYISAGVQLVWLVIPQNAEVRVYTSENPFRILYSSDILTGEPLFPGFRLPIAELFPPTTT